MSESKKKATLDGETEMHWISACVCFVFYLISCELKGTTWIPRGPPSLDTSTGLSMLLRDGDGWSQKGEKMGVGERCMNNNDNKKITEVKTTCKNAECKQTAQSTTWGQRDAQEWGPEGVGSLLVGGLAELPVLSHPLQSATGGPQGRLRIQMEAPIKWLRSDCCCAKRTN